MESTTPTFSRTSDSALRDDPALRIAAANLVTLFGQLLQDQAARFVKATGGNPADPFAVDRAAADLLWTLLEYAEGVNLDRSDDDWSFVAKPHQFDADHAAYFFDLDQVTSVSFTPRPSDSSSSDSE